MTLAISVAAVRDYLELEANNPTGASQYSDATIGSNIEAAQAAIEAATNRYFVDRTFVIGSEWMTTTMLRAQVPIPGFRTFTQVLWGGAVLVNDQSFWAQQDQQRTGVYVAMQFRAFRADAQGLPWWVADPQWFDKALDSPFYPGNYGGGYFYASMPNDLRIAGSAGYVAGTEPPPFLHATKVLASFYTKRPASILADVAITPQGGVLTYSQMPAEVRDFVAAWRIGQQAVSVGG